MLQEILLTNEASYSALGQSLFGLKPINFIFGTNGSGKTTISRVINNAAQYPNCKLTWENNQPLECLIYNSDFSSNNYSAQMPGISEGERSFVTFLYFYHLVRGSKTQSGMNAKRIIVFDDPVSSLDSDVLFIVSSLIKGLLSEAIKGDGLVRQVFILTHNIYFHKEVSFDTRRKKECQKHETFWIIKKIANESKIINYKFNPIKTSYELLWAEVRNPNNLTIQNVLRRILENYFKILGNCDSDWIIQQFEGRDQQICGSLFSWVNDGSHSAHDDLYISTDDEMVNRYLKVFKEIFVKTAHEKHYDMMLGIESASDTARDASAVAL